MDTEQLSREEIRDRVENHYGINISKVTRKREYIDAKRIYCYMARINRHTLESIGKLIGIGHDTVLHHERTAKGWVANNDSEFNPKIDLLFNLYTYKHKDLVVFEGEDEEFKELFRDYLPTLKQIPPHKVKETLERLKMVIKGYEWMAKGEDESKIRLDR